MSEPNARASDMHRGVLDEVQELREFRRDHIDAWHLFESKNKWMARAVAAEAFLEREGYRRCDAPACNCGSWHSVIPECTCDGGEQGEGLVSIPHEPHCALYVEWPQK